MNELKQVYEAIKNGARTSMEIKTATRLDYNKINRATSILREKYKVIDRLSANSFMITSKRYEF